MAACSGARSTPVQSHMGVWGSIQQGRVGGPGRTDVSWGQHSRRVSESHTCARGRGWGAHGGTEAGEASPEPSEGGRSWGPGRAGRVLMPHHSEGTLFPQKKECEAGSFLYLVVIFLL